MDERALTLNEKLVALWGKQDGQAYRLTVSHDSELPSVATIYQTALGKAKNREIPFGDFRNLYNRRFTFYALLSPAARIIPKRPY